MQPKDTTKQISWLSLLIIAILCILPNLAKASDLSKAKANQLLEDTTLMSAYLNLKGESDYIKNEENIIKAALFGAFDAKSRFIFEQEERNEKGKKPLPKTTALFSVNGKSITPDKVLMRNEAASVFKNYAETFTCFISKDAAELAALYFTGHTLKKHFAPQNDALLGRTILTDNGYYVSIEGLGDQGTEAKLKNIKAQGNGFVLTGNVISVMDDGDTNAKPKTFRLILTPGEVSGSWKRQYSEK